MSSSVEPNDQYQPKSANLTEIHEKYFIPEDKKKHHDKMGNEGLSNQINCYQSTPLSGLMSDQESFSEVGIISEEDLTLNQQIQKAKHNRNICRVEDLHNQFMEESDVIDTSEELMTIKSYQSIKELCGFKSRLQSHIKDANTRNIKDGRY